MAVSAVAASSAGFFNSMTASGSPLTKSTTSGRRSAWPSATANWLTASQSFASGSSKSTARTIAPAIEPSGRANSTVIPSTSIRCAAWLRAMSDGASSRVSFRKASSTACGGRPGFRRARAARSRPSRTTSRYPGSVRSAPRSPTAISGPWRTCQPSSSSQPSAASSTTDSVIWPLTGAPSGPRASRGTLPRRCRRRPRGAFGPVGTPPRRRPCPEGPPVSGRSSPRWR